MPQMPEQSPASMWNYYIGVDDIDRAAEAVKAGGGQMLHEPMEIPGGEYARQRRSTRRARCSASSARARMRR